MFEGNAFHAAEYLGRIRGNFYVYELLRPNGTVFYVGKGKNNRALEHEREAMLCHPIGESNPFKCNVIRKIHDQGLQVGYRIDSIYDQSDEEGCLRREAFLIKAYGRRHEGGPLTNLAGGQGNSSSAHPYSKKKHAATLSGAPATNPDRATLNMFLQGIGPVQSVPIKPISQIARILPTTPHPNPRNPTKRSAYALIASASANGITLTPGCTIPRCFTYLGVQGIIENGVSRDILKAGMADLITASDPQDELFTLDEEQLEILNNLVGTDTLSAIGLT